MAGSRVSRWSSCAAVLLGVLALGAAGTDPSAVTPYSYEVLAVGDYAYPLSPEFAPQVASLRDDEVFVATLGLMGGRWRHRFISNPELHCRIAEWQMTDCAALGPDMVDDGSMTYLVIRTGERSFKELRLHMPGCIAGMPREFVQ